MRSTPVFALEHPNAGRSARSAHSRSQSTSRTHARSPVSHSWFCTTEPCSISGNRPCREWPMTMLPTFCSCVICSPPSRAEAHAVGGDASDRPRSRQRFTRARPTTNVLAISEPRTRIDSASSSGTWRPHTSPTIWAPVGAQPVATGLCFTGGAAAGGRARSGSPTQCRQLWW
jgi:hypothetical protein